MTSPQDAFGDYQLEIYGAGLRGVLPGFPTAFAELEARAEQALPPSVLSYVAGGAGSEHTQQANVSAFRQWGLIPRMFVWTACPGWWTPPAACPCSSIPVSAPAPT